jgi:HEAT repeat protein/Na+/melibiose symporter-like transporter
MSQHTEGLSPSQTVRGLRAFMGTGILFGLWARCSGLGTAVLTGYILWLGGSRSDVAWLTSCAYLFSLIQVFTVQHTTKLKNRKAFIVGGGILEIVARSSIILIPLIASERPTRVLLIYLVICGSLCVGHSIAPLLNDWLSQTIPERLRAQYTGQRTTWITVVGIVAGYLFGKFLDHFGENLASFACLSAFGCVAGIAGYLCLARAPMHTESQKESGSVWQAMKSMWTRRDFRTYLIFATLKMFVIGISTPFYMVYFIQELKLGYASIAIFTNIALVATLVAYRFVGNFVDRFGSRPVMLMIILPGAFGQLLRVFTSEESYIILPISMAIYAMFHASMFVAMNPLLYSLMPQKKDQSAWFAAWNCVTFMFGALAPLVGNLLADLFKDFHTVWFGYPIGNLQIVFLCTSIGLLLMAPLILLIEEKKAVKASELVVQIIKGRPLAYAYHSFNMSRFVDEERRAHATRGMGTSGSPLAVESLLKALSDISPDVRRKAAEGLGDLGSYDAVDSLIGHLADKESDIRAEAAEALGKIKHPLSVDALMSALEDPDSGVRNSAIRGLGNIGGDGIRQFLFEHLYMGEFDRQTIPTALDVLSRLDEARIVTIGLGRLNDYSSPILRAQILNSICRVLGAGETFYQLTIMDELQQASKVTRALAKAQKDLEASSREIPALGLKPVEDMKEIREQFDEGRLNDAYRTMIRLAGHIVEATDTDSAADSSVELILARGSAGALCMFAAQVSSEEVTELEIVFASICLCLCIAELQGINQE